MKQVKRIYLIAILVIGQCLPIPLYAQRKKTQMPISLVRYMPNMPYPYKMKDWKAIAVKQDQLFYDFHVKGRFLPLIWWDDSQVNFPIRSFGLPSYVGSERNSLKGNHYESLPVIGSLIGASLVGIDKSNQNGIDYISMSRQFFNKSNGVNLVQNTVNNTPGKTFWYEIWPNMAYAMLVDLYPEENELKEPLEVSAKTWMKAISVLSSGREYPDFDYTAFNFQTGKGFNNNVWREPDAAAGLAWFEFVCWKKFRKKEYLTTARSCMDFLENRPKEKGPYYEIMMPYGAYLAVRMNAELGTHYNELKMLDWCFDGNNSDRDGWGVMAERWGAYDVAGLVGQKKWEHYAFAMNTFSQAAALVPIVKYNQAYAKSIGKWILNLANASRLFYADEHPRNRQSSALWQGDPDHVICYEGCRKNLDDGNHFEVFKGILADEGPYAIGDQVKTMSSYTDLCLYGSAWVGMLAAVVDTTTVPGILKIDCNATDFFSDRRFPTYLFYNPWFEERSVSIEAGNHAVNLYDLTSGKMIRKNVSGQVEVRLPGDSATVLVLIPSSSHLKVEGRELLADGLVIDYQCEPAR